MSIYSVYPDGGDVVLVHLRGWTMPRCLFSEALAGGYPGASLVGKFLRGNLEEEKVDPHEHPWIYRRCARLVGALPENIAVFRLRAR